MEPRCSGTRRRMFSVEYEFEHVYCVTTAAVINRDCMSCDTPLRFIAWSPGIAREQTCNGCCRNWQLISGMSISPARSVISLSPRNSCTRPASASSNMHEGDSMSDTTLLGPWVRRFLLEHLVAERNLARNTQRSYRDALVLLIPFVGAKQHQSVDRLSVVNVSADL